MKHLSFFFYAIASLAFFAFSCNSGFKNNKKYGDDGHNSQNSLDWAGVYQGTLPCADCDGILTTLQINSDESYRIQSEYLGAEEENIFSERGTLKWDKSGQKITLNNGSQYFVGENRLFGLDDKGEKVTGALADNYSLAKIDGQLEGVHWELTSLNGKEVDPDLDKKPYLMLDAQEQRISGNGSCNQLMGKYTKEGDDKITFSQIASTMMACPDLSLEDEYTKMLEQINRYEVQGDELTLEGDDGISAEFTAKYF